MRCRIGNCYVPCSRSESSSASKRRSAYETQHQSQITTIHHPIKTVYDRSDCVSSIQSRIKRAGGKIEMRPTLEYITLSMLHNWLHPEAVEAA